MNEASSSYLSNIAARYASDLAQLADDDETALRALIESTSALPCDKNVEPALRRCKALFAYRWSHSRIQHTLDAATLGRLQTAFAEATISKALAAAWAEPQMSRYVAKAEPLQNGAIPGLFILGLGKLGGYDLNFSSDIDLVAFYDTEHLPVASVHGRSDVVSRVLKRMAQILSKPVEQEFVWRVDWRLRPNASAMSLCMPSEAAQEFYFFHSYPWHRLAMIKARVVAGDIDTGNAFLQDLEPYLWRQNLDYQMVDEIFKLKQKINREHPQLKHARSSGALNDPENKNGYNLKLGRGGIREIEFVVNGMQLLWGGKKPQLRTQNTVQTLANLEDAGLLPAEARQQLTAAYRFYRLLEDALQMLENQQTQTLPRETAQLNRLLQLLGRSDADALWAELTEHRKTVSAIFDGTFNTRQQDDAADVAVRAETMRWVEELPASEKAIYEAWQKGFANYGVNPAHASALQPLFLQLAELLDETSMDRTAAINKLHDFFVAIPRGGQYLRLLAEHHLLLQDIVTPLLYSPHMSSLLEQSPHIVDLLLEPHSRQENDPAFDSDFVLQTNDFEMRLERLRRFVNEQLYLHFLQLLRGEIGAPELQRTLTALAEHTIHLGLKIGCEETRLTQAPIAVIGMGKLGMRAMAPMSDLDLIFVSDDNIDLEQANQFSNRLQHLMELRTREGRAYEMDMRLRPSGRSGPATVSMRSFAEYQLNNAKTWEHIALTAGRAVAGSAELQAGITGVRAEVLSKPRDSEQLKLDAAKMLRRLQEQRIGKKKDLRLDVKLRSGGLMELDYLCACACLLAAPSKAMCEKPYEEMVLACCAADSPAAKIFAGETGVENFQRSVGEAMVFWRRLQIWSRLTRLEDDDMESLPTAIRDALLIDMQCESLDDLKQRIDSTSAFVSAAINALQADFEKSAPDNWESWQEAPVRWR
ncbi:MAG: hypothetical protein HKO60_04585 [Pseudomonadales bacterium]|nr:hypothetical protein [Pseudomonadales bacterium]